MRMFRFATIVVVVPVACGGADAQQRTPAEFVAAIQAKLASTTRECVTFNEAKTRGCFKDYRLSIRNGQLINLRYSEFLFAKSNYQAGAGYKPESVRIELARLKSAVTIKRPGYSGEQPSFYVEMRCSYGKCVTGLSGNEYDVDTFYNINDEPSANEIASLMNQLIAVCKVPNACQEIARRK